MVLTAAACTTVNVDPIPAEGGTGGALPVAGAGGTGGSAGASGGGSGASSGSGGAGGSGTGSGGTGGSTGGTTGIIVVGAGGSANGGSDGDAGVEQGDGAAPAVVNLISNSDFEAGLPPWSAKFGGTLALTTEPVYRGAHSAKLTGRTEDYQGVFHDITGLITPGATYTATAFAYTSNGTAATALLKLTARLLCLGLGGETYLTIRSLTSSVTNWSELTGQLPIPTPDACSVTEAILYVEGPASGFDLYVDDVTLVEN
jgi:hypothetical protein